MKYNIQGEGSPVILIHGFPLSAKIWREQVQFFSGKGYQVITPDLSGFGENVSEPAAEKMSDYSDQIIGMMDELGIEKAFIGGMSMGGYVTLDLLTRFPERFTSVGLMVTRSDADGEEAVAKRNHLIQEVTEGRPETVNNAFIGLMFAKSAGDEVRSTKEEVFSWMEQSSDEGLIGALKAIRDRKDNSDALKSVKVPALIIGAKEDQAIPPEFSEKMDQNLNNSEIHLIEKAGHLVMMEQPQEFNEILLKFLQKHS